ncbi:MAG: GWxTD domain-containing protein [Thermoanaerobaculales bacterium]
MRHKGTILLFTFILALLIAPLGEAQLSDEYAKWADGPERFLLTKKEKKEWSKITTDAAAERFIELFWARRNPEENNPFNAFKAEFEARVRYADEHFAYRGTRGALSDRGKVLLLMGGPQASERRAPNEPVVGASSGAAATDAVRGRLEQWAYDSALLPEEFKVKGARVYFTFYEERIDSNRFLLDRSNREAMKAVHILAEAPEVLLLHPDLQQVPKPISVPGARPASPAHLGWLGQPDAPMNDIAKVLAELGVMDTVSRPLWVHIELPPDAPTLEVLAGRVTTADGEVVSTFEVDAEPLEGQAGAAYHLWFPLAPGAYTVQVAGGTAAGPQFTRDFEVEISSIPEDGPWMSPLWVGVSAEADADAPLGSPFRIGGWHVMPVTSPEMTREAELVYFGFLVRPGADEEGKVKLRARIKVKKDGKPFGRPFSMPLEISPIAGDLYMYGNSIQLSGLPETGAYEMDFKIVESISGTVSERTLALEISAGNAVLANGDRDFAYSNVSVRRTSAGYFEAIGEVTNNSGKSYQTAKFTISLFDGERNLLDVQEFFVSNLTAGETKSFDVIVERPFAEIENYKIDFNLGQ